jgi:alpha-methylacyl-CoA racemase
MKAELGKIIKSKTRDQWAAIMERSDACFAPVLSMLEAPEHHHMRARNTFIEVDGVMQAAPAPRFPRTNSQVRRGSRPVGADGTAVLLAAGMAPEEIEKLRRDGVLTGA